MLLNRVSFQDTPPDCWVKFTLSEIVPHHNDKSRSNATLLLVYLTDYFSKG
ncbi:hypothetical protein GA0116948_1333 [Chitinophaga costaii]|uniref:Uncharacterized protein n=1 Tax=Chitinophaga costaii TaxID=1335309 RepID=A0A1C4G8G6_9BACT|nr:hypothetical protein GA0116948_1333 [Chitinophaga costaii]